MKRMKEKRDREKERDRERRREKQLEHLLFMDSIKKEKEEMKIRL